MRCISSFVESQGRIEGEQFQASSIFNPSTSQISLLWLERKRGMAGGLSLDHPWAFAFGILGNLISFMVYLAPIPTFRRIYRKKTTEGFQSVPYVVALFSAMLWIYYAFIKTNMYLLITINSFGLLIETIYIIIFLIYAPKSTKIYTAKIIFLLNVSLFSSIVLVTLFLFKGSSRITVLGWICVAFSVSVFAAPLSIIRLVIRTKSVEFMPFSLSFFLTLSAVVWFSFGLFSKDIYIALPNVLGFAFGALQMVLYIIYKDAKVSKSLVDEKLPEHIIAIDKLDDKVIAMEVKEKRMGNDCHGLEKGDVGMSPA